MDRLLWMETFIKVVDMGHFSAAAHKLHVSKAAVSKYIYALEEHLGTQLINRTTRRLSLTQEGEAYLTRCRAILEDIQEVEASIGSMQTEPKGVLRINGPMSFGHLHLASAVADFLERYPEIRIEFELTDRLVDVVDEGWDVVIRIGQLHDSTLLARKLAPSLLVLCGTPAYFERYGQPKHPADLKEHLCLGYSYTAMGNSWSFTNGDGQEERMTFVPRLRVNNGDVIRKVVLQSLGIALSPTFIVGQDLQAGTLQAVLTDWQLPTGAIYAVYPQNRRLSAKVRVFIDFLTDRFGAHPYWDWG